MVTSGVQVMKASENDQWGVVLKRKPVVKDHWRLLGVF